MLFDPFYENAPAYSGHSTGVIEIPDIIGVDAISLLQMMKSILEQAGWTAAGNFPSTGVQTALIAMMPVAAVPSVPVAPLPHPDGCSGSLFPQWIQATVNGIDYVAYDPYKYIRPLGCDTRVFYPAGLTPQETAENLAVAISTRSSFLVQYTGDVATMHQFKFTSHAPGWEADAEGIRMAGGSRFTTKGFYRLRSPVTDEGGFLEAKLQTYALWGVFGIDEDAVLGTLTPFITIKGSGGGTDDGYRQPIFNTGLYWMCATAHQFAIWSGSSSALVASLLKPDAGHPTGANGVVVYGSDSYSWLGWGATGQVTRQLHWERSFATGFGSGVNDVGPRSQEFDNNLWRDPTVLLRGLRGIPLKTATTSYPLVQSAYVLVSGDPNLHSEVQIGGRMWDMIVASDSSLFTGLIDQDGMALYDQYHWMKLATASISGDVTSSLWIKMEADGADALKRRSEEGG